MLKKQISLAFLLVMSSLTISNHCLGGPGYVVFGNPPGCSSSGICNSSSVSALYQGTTPTPVTFVATTNAENTQCTLSMVINMNALSTNQPAQYTMFNSGSYIFMHSVKITGNLLGGPYFQANPTAYVMIPANFSVTIPVTVVPEGQLPPNKTIDFGTLPIMH